MQRAYHFVPLCHGLDDLRQRHLKIAQLDELNDPFELWAIAQPNQHLRRAFRATKRLMAEEHGVLCFSLDWHNPLLWSHYADRHRGLALGFDVSEEILKPVSYVNARPLLTELNLQVANWLLFTKYKDWRYEKEARIFTTLQDRDPKTGLYFGDFGEQLVLREVIAGPLCTATREELFNATGSATEIILKKARLAFKTFRIVTDQREFKNPHRQVTA